MRVDESTQPTAPPRFVLERQAELHDRLARPDEMTAAFFWAFARDCVRPEKGGEAMGNSMFYPHRVHRSTSESRKWCGTMAAGLFQARSFQVTSEMMDAVTALYGKTSEGVLHMEERELPSEHGFAWLDKPLLSRDRQGRDVAERAVTWDLVTVRLRSLEPRPDAFGIVQALAEPEAGYDAVSGVRIAAWSWIKDEDFYTADPRWTPEVAEDLASLGQLTLSHVMVIPFAQRFAFPAGANPDGTDNMLGWLHALWMFMETEFTTTRPQRADRAARRRIAGSVLHGEVNVILLRRAASHREDGESEPRAVDWSCRWLVQGHWRHVSYGAEAGKHHAISGGPDGTCQACHGRLTWIRPFIKGPDDKPLRASEQLYRLAR